MLTGMDRKDFGTYLKQLRNSKKMSCRVVANKTGVSRVHLSSIENGINNHSFELMKPLSEALGVTHIGLLIKAGYITEEEVLIMRENNGITEH